MGASFAKYNTAVEWNHSKKMFGSQKLTEENFPTWQNNA